VFVALYNLVFIAPLAAVTGIVALTGDRYGDRIRRVSDLLREHAPVVLPVGVACIGAALVLIGAHGLKTS